MDANLSGIKDAESFCYKADGEWTLTTERVVFAIGDVGLGELTPENWKTAFSRYLADCRLNGYELHLGPQDFKRHIGLKIGMRSVRTAEWAEASMTLFLSSAMNSIDWEV